ncbi:hypothetical protein ARMA_0732 [Ardenticatena maritima]|uniref:Alpha-amylase n=1 Tax=Ardenticatena maritima TaxID=872965 RepID=A0A0M8K7Z2_9CHLR|nr:alpha-amylase family glycosyl hydrolase [Ardenticatena maritima]GAP62309.1 hypothetical protein ARMA_0732 [Ardenticatena maritima]
MASSSVWRFRWTFFILSLLALAFLLPFVVQAAATPHPDPITTAATAPTTAWCLAGDFNSWNNASTPLYDDGTHGDLIPGDGVFSRDETIATAGRYEFKIVECGNWSNAYPSQNAWLYTASDNRTVKFTFDTNDHSTDAGMPWGPTQNIVNVWDDTPTTYTAVGDWQGWNNSDPATALTSLGNGIYYLTYTIASPGTYMAKIVQTGSWNEQFVQDGRAKDGSPVNFTTSAPNETVVFVLNVRTGRWFVAPNGSSSGNWCLAGDFNSWDNASTPLYDDGTHGDLLGGDGIFSLDVTIPTAGRYEWKVVECGNWSNTYPAQNAWLSTASDNRTVKFTFDTNDHSADAGVALLPTQNIVNAWDDAPTTYTAVGDFQGWNNSDPATALTHHGNGWHTLMYTITTAGAYIGKVTSTGSWDAFGADGRSKDAANIAFSTTSDNQPVLFVLDAQEGRVNILPQGGGTTPPPTPSGACSSGAAHDGDIWWNDLGHNSRDTLYRVPGGAVTTGVTVTLRLRAACGDLTEALVRIWNDRLDAEQVLPMQKVLESGQYEWWELSLPVGNQPTIYWYRFIVKDGGTTAYYEDDDARTGGWGQTYATSPDNSWQLTVYDPAFQTPDWVKNAVIYQIFPDRFRDGDPTNNPPAGRFFYDEPDGTIVRSGGADWNTPICDPRDANECPGKWSQNFYGGDLEGIRQKLDYLQSLGITAIYLNPIFESPSNHKYDTTDYSQISQDFGDLQTFISLTQEAHARGIKVILDGVFNHTSSDSIYFDRYHRYPAPDGACESETSPYRDWYFFRPAAVAGTGACAGDTDYEAWFGYDSLPKLNSAMTDVRQLIWDSPNAIARYWLQWADGWRLDVAGDVDPGVTNDPTNDYWEGFRAAVRDANPDAYIVGEEWGLATAWTLGNEWDATMNYQFGSALLSFWRDEPFVDNDHNSASSAGVLTPLTPSELNERLLNLQERYPPEAFYAMMNLLDSHDTNRALFMLDHNTDLNDSTLYDDPNYDWSDAITRLKGVALLQMTLPGAPTIYYGDEVGLVGPVTFDGSTWQDDPYNRVPFPWLDESGTPFYAHLQSQASQDALRTYYQTLIAARNAHPALRVGSFDPLLTDDAANVYAFGRKLPDHSDAAVVVVNRATVTQTVTVTVSGYLPIGAVFEDVLSGNTYTVDANGRLVVANVPPMSGAVLVATSALAPAPAPVSDLAVVAEQSHQLVLAWSAVANADEYDVYRSELSGGGYTFITTTTATRFTDTNLTNAKTYYYVVVARNSATGLESGYSNEAAGTPHHDLSSAWFNLQWPYEITHTISALTPTESIYGQLWIDGATGPNGPADGIWAQVGFGPLGEPPTSTLWTWFDMSYNAAVGNNDEYVGTLLPETVGEFVYTTRWSSDGGRTWFYADRNGPGYNEADAGRLHVIPSADTTPPAAPAALWVVATTPGSITIGWSAVTDTDLVGYEIYRAEGVNAPPLTTFTRLARVNAAATTYTDTAVTTGSTYHYYVLAYDTSFNRSAPSNVVSATAEARPVTVHVVVTVPDYTPGTVYFSRVVNADGTLGGWEPAGVPLTKVNTTTWTTDLTLLDGTKVEYKFTRGTWETVEKAADGNTEIANRTFTVAYGSTGEMTVTASVANWRDPLVVAHEPAANAVDVPVTTTIRVQWNQAIVSDTLALTLEGPGGVVSGTATLDAATNTVIFTPSMRLQGGTPYTVTVAGQVDAGGDVQQVPTIWTFTTRAYRLFLPLLFRQAP